MSVKPLLQKRKNAPQPLPASIRSPKFTGSIKTEETRTTYENALVRFLAWAKAKDLTAIPNLRDKLIDYVVHLKKEGKSFSTQNIIISAVRKWAEAYDKEINFDKVYNYMSEQTTSRDDKPYSLVQLRALIEAADPRRKAVILTLVSTGVRVGALPEMRIKDLTKIAEHDIYKISVYPTSTQHTYYVFTTPEATHAIDAYLDMRRVSGEEIKPDAPLFRKEYGKHNVNEPKALRKDQLTSLVTDLLVKIGLRVLGDMHARHETRVMHGFRKFYNTALVKVGVKPVVLEILLGHKIGLQGSYLRLTEDEVLAEALKAIPALTISDAPELKRQVRELEVRVGDVDVVKRAYMDLKLESEKKDSQVQEQMRAMFAVIAAQDEKSKQAALAKLAASGLLETSKLD